MPVNIILEPDSLLKMSTLYQKMRDFATCAGAIALLGVGSNVDNNATPEDLAVYSVAI
jgi:hypothetical protein